ncbi:hypothetical protein FUAX_21780 [Fulvitalea axinellae]|uniref:Uncharacterized protein n=1 Tax=Fulvitalea axinellae TaxID=1182444 RepID=A0AAU9DA10_9BACT|nr:hypothetical protein FUAX_21780 [Fulvitalea axinellae]
MFQKRERPKQYTRNQTKSSPNSQQPIQCDIGFEFEVPNWGVFRRYDPPETPLTPAEEEAETYYKIGHTLFESDFWTAKTDANEDRTSHLELETIPFHESVSGYKKLLEVLPKIQEFLYFVQSAPGTRIGNVKVLPMEMFKRYGQVKSPEARIGMPVDKQEPKIFPQASAGIRLDKLHKLFDDLAAPTEQESAREEYRKQLGRKFLHSDQETGNFKEGSPHDARYVVNSVDITVKQIEEMWGDRFSSSFKGFLTMVLFYLVEGSFGSRTYAKAFTAFLARTDFARMFDILPEDEKEILREEDCRIWLDIVSASVPEDMRDLSKPVFEGGIFKEKAPVHHNNLSALSRKDWLVEMTRGRDLLTKRHFPNRLRAYELESMGAFGDKTDTIFGVPAPVIEFRSGKKEQGVRDALAYAASTFRYIFALHRDMDCYYGENPNL